MSSENSLKFLSHTGDRLRSFFRPTPAPYASVAAFRDLYETTHLSIFRFIYGLSNGPVEDVEDLTADTYEKAWKARNSFSGDADAAMGWLVTIARNVTIDQQRKQKRRPPSQSLDQVEPTTLTSPTVEQQAIGQEEQALILELLERLPIQDREILLLRYLLGWPVKQIAHHTGMVENTVSVRMRRALATMRQQLDPSGGNDQ